VFEDNGSGFIEVYNADKLIVESRQITAEGSASVSYYYYNRGFLIRAETRLFTPRTGKGDAAAAPSGAGASPALGGAEAVPVPRTLVPGAEPVATADGTEEPLWTDVYRYTRAGALRSVERRYLRSPEEGRETEVLRFPQLVIGVAPENEFIQPALALSSEFFSDVIVNSGDRIIYNTDARGRVLSETRRDENDKIIGEIINTWSGDRLVSVVWKSEDEERTIEYEYDAEGDRVFERNLRDGVLERTVRRDGDQEIEELYLNGEAVLRALWVEGRKVSEEPIRRSPGTRGRGE
jgi:hypothetical protein